MITIYGATGYTGRLCAAEAVRRGLDVRLAGRRREALERLASELSVSDIAVADATDPGALAELAEASTVLLSTVGPYERWGRPVVQAALAAGCDYLDVTGEVPFLEWVFAQQQRAAAAGARLCPGFGFDGVPGELAAVAAARQTGAVVDAKIAYLVRHGRASRGTIRSGIGMLDGGGRVWRDGRLAEEPAFAEAWTAPFPEPLGSRASASLPLPEVVTVGRSLGAGVVRAYGVVPAAGVLPAVAPALGRLASGLGASPVRAVLERLADRLPEGPPPEDRQRTKAAVLAEVTDADGKSARVWVRLADVYGITAIIAIAMIERLVGSDVPAGVRTPSEVVGAGNIEEFCARIGARIETLP